MPYFIEGLTDV